MIKMPISEHQMDVFLALLDPFKLIPFALSYASHGKSSEGIWGDLHTLIALISRFEMGSSDKLFYWIWEPHTNYSVPYLLASSSHQLFHIVWKHTRVPSLSNITTLGWNMEDCRVDSDIEGENTDIGRTWGKWCCLAISDKTFDRRGEPKLYC